MKSRAATNNILFNRLMDEHEGNSTYILYFPNGGTAYVIGNLIQQGCNAENRILINFGGVGNRRTAKGLFVANNTIVSNRNLAVFWRNRVTTPATIVNNIFAGRGTVQIGPAKLIANLIAKPPGSLEGS